MTAAMQAAAPVGVSEAARRLGVHKSTVSRQVREGKIPNRGTRELPLVDVEEARRARAANLDHAKRRGGRSPLYAAGGASALGPAGPSGEAGPPEVPFASAELAAVSPSADVAEPAGNPSAPAPGMFVQARAERELWNARRAARDYARENALLVGRAGVEEAMTRAARLLGQRVIAGLASLAGRLAGMSDERTIAALLREEATQMLARAGEDIAQAAEDPDGGGDDPPAAADPEN